MYNSLLKAHMKETKSDTYLRDSIFTESSVNSGKSATISSFKCSATLTSSNSGSLTGSKREKRYSKSTGYSTSTSPVKSCKPFTTTSSCLLPESNRHKIYSTSGVLSTPSFLQSSKSTVSEFGLLCKTNSNESCSKSSGHSTTSASSLKYSTPSTMNSVSVSESKRHKVDSKHDMLSPTCDLSETNSKPTSTNFPPAFSEFKGHKSLPKSTSYSASIASSLDYSTTDPTFKFKSFSVPRSNKHISYPESSGYSTTTTRSSIPSTAVSSSSLPEFFRHLNCYKSGENEINSRSTTITASPHKSSTNFNSFSQPKGILPTTKSSKSTLTIDPNPVGATNFIYINKDKIPSSAPPGKSCIYYNPKFFKSSNQEIPHTQLSNLAKDSLSQLKTKKERIHINPSFIRSQLARIENNTPLPTTKEGLNEKKVFERVYLNPKFIKVDSSANGEQLVNKIHNGNQVPDIRGDVKSNFKDTSNYPVQVNSISSQSHQNVVESNLGVNSLNRINKYKLINPRSTVLKKKSSPQVKESRPAFKKTKYSLIRRRSQIQIPTKNQENIAPKKDTPMKDATSKIDPFKALGRTKLVRKSILQSQILARRHSTNSKALYVKKIVQWNVNNVKPIASYLKSKYKLITKPPLENKKHTVPFLKSKYKITRNLKNSALRRRDSQKQLFAINKHRMSVRSAISGKRHFARYKSSQHLKKGLNRLKSQFISINGIAYRASYNKLIKKDPCLELVRSRDALIRVRGSKFKLENGGLTLRKIDKSSGNIKRIDIGGETYVQSPTANVLQKTNVHSSRMRLRAAKQKSIAVLTAKLKKCNEPCPFFNRFGYCLRKQKGSCNRVHDKKYVSLCKKFLKDDCKDEKCLLSHSAIPEKMPICHHYLKNGGCTRDICLYVHVKHNEKTPICSDFLKGYCEKAGDCPKKHIFLCPIFAEKGTCPRGKRCRYPHQKQRPPKKEIQSRKRKLSIKDKVPPKKKEKVSNERYFVNPDLITLREEDLIEENDDDDAAISISDSDEDSSTQEKKTNFLPEYIPL